MQDLGTLAPTSRDDLGGGHAINASGQVTGDGPTGGFLYSNGTLQSIPIRGYSINDQGQIVGQSAQVHAALYSNGVVTDLGTLNGAVSSEATHINNKGQIVGDSSIDATNATTHGFLYQNGVMQDLGTLPGQTYSYARAINESGLIVGTSEDDPFVAYDPVAVCWQNGQIHALGTLPGGLTSDAFAVNNSGMIVGASNIPGNQTRPFVYQNGQMSDVFAGTGWSYGIAEGINDSGQIVGVGVSPENGLFRAFLATPHVANTPAPGSLLVVVVGVGLLAGRLRRRRL